MMNNTINSAFVNTLERPWSQLKEFYEFSLEELAWFEKEHNGLNPDQFYHIYHSYADNIADLLSKLPNTVLDTRFEFPEKKVEKEYPSAFLIYEIDGGVDMREYWDEYQEFRTLKATFLSRKSAERYVEKFNSQETIYNNYFTKTYNKLEIVETKLISSEDFDEYDDLGHSSRPWDSLFYFAKSGYSSIEDLPSRRILSELLNARGIKLTEYGLEQMLVDVFKSRVHCPERTESNYTCRGHINWQKIEWEELLDDYSLRKEELEKEIYPEPIITPEPIISKQPHKWLEEDWELDPFNI